MLPKPEDLAQGYIDGKPGGLEIAVFDVEGICTRVLTPKNQANYLLINPIKYFPYCEFFIPRAVSSTCAAEIHPL